MDAEQPPLILWLLTNKLYREWKSVTPPPQHTLWVIPTKTNNPTKAFCQLSAPTPGGDYDHPLSIYQPPPDLFHTMLVQNNDHDMLIRHPQFYTFLAYLS